MQPHSMCAVALVNYMWNRHSPTGIKSCVMNVEYYLRGKYRLNKYELTGIKESEDRKSIKVYIMRSGGGIACQITAERNSASEGSKVTLTHSQNHISGLREEFNLYKNKVIQGRHYNSQKYRNFSGESRHPDRIRFQLDSEIKRKDDFEYLSYELEMDSIS